MREALEPLFWIAGIAALLACAVAGFSSGGVGGGAIGAFCLVVAVLVLVWRFYLTAQGWDW